MSFRDWLNITVTGFIGWLAATADGGLVALWFSAYYRRADLENTRENVKTGVRWFFNWLPDLLGFARDWLTSLIIGYVVDPIYNILTWPFSFVMDRLSDLWVPAWGHYKPVKYGADALYHIKDRLLDLVDFATNLVNGARSYLTGLLGDAYNALLGFTNGVASALNTWAAWVTNTVWAKALELATGLADTNRMLSQVWADLEVIRRDPGAWVWANVEPALQQKVEQWLNRIWYS